MSIKPHGSQFQWFETVEEHPDEGYTTRSMDLYSDPGEETSLWQGEVRITETQGNDTQRSNWTRYANSPVDPPIDHSTRQVYDHNDRARTRTTTVQQKMFDGGEVYPAKHIIGLAAFADRDAAERGFGEVMGMAANNAKASGAELVASQSLSDHSGPLVNRLSDAGLVSVMDGRRWDPSRSNGMGFQGTAEEQPPKGSRQVSSEERSRGIKTTRSAMRQLYKQRPKRMRGEQTLF